MRVKLLSNLDHNNISYKKDETVDLPDRIVEGLVQDGVVSVIKDEEPAKPKTKKLETPKTKTPNPEDEGEGSESQETEEKPLNRMSQEELVAYGQSKYGLKDLDKLSNRNEVFKAVREAEKAAEVNK